MMAAALTGHRSNEEQRAAEGSLATTGLLLQDGQSASASQLGQKEGPTAASSPQVSEQLQQEVAGCAFALGRGTQRRLASLDIVRGLAIAVMIFVDDIAAAYPSLTHAPWNGLNLADFVMPWFLFMVGASLAVSTKSARSSVAGRRCASWSGLQRSLKLLLLGILLQGGGWPETPSKSGGYVFGYNLCSLRFCGILQRIAFAFLLVLLMDLWVPELKCNRLALRRPHLRLFMEHLTKWLVAMLIVIAHAALTFGVWVPSWQSDFGWNASSGKVELLPEPFKVQCNGRGLIATPECSASGYFDRLIFGQAHLGVWESKRLPQCSSCSPGGPDDRYRPDCHFYTVSGSPAPTSWCFAYIYDPEGSLSSLPTVMTVWLGVHFGRLVLADMDGHFGSGGLSSGFLLHAFSLSLASMAAGWAIDAAGWHMNKQLWSASYLFFTAGSCGFAFALAYAFIDAGSCYSQRPLGSFGQGMGRVVRRTLLPLEKMGKNAILIFFWYYTAEVVLASVYVVRLQPGNGAAVPALGALVGEYGWIHEHLLGAVIGDEAHRQLAYVLLKVSAFALLAWLCDSAGYYWKL